MPKPLLPSSSFMTPRAPAWLLARPIAHRGLHDAQRPENSLAACDAAVAADYPIELDVHLGNTGELVVFHDDELGRMTGASGSLADTPWSRLSSLRLAGTDEPIPRLEQVLARVRGRVPLILDLKSGRAPGKLEDAVTAALANYRGEIALQSFNPFAIARLRRASRSRVLGLLSCEFDAADLSRLEKFALRRLLLAPLAMPNYVGYELRCLPYWAASAARRFGVALVAWTVRSEAELARAAALADNCIFEVVRP